MPLSLLLLLFDAIQYIHSLLMLFVNVCDLIGYTLNKVAGFKALIH